MIGICPRSFIAEKWQIHNEKHGWQSPIAITRDESVRKKLPPLRFENYESKFNVLLKNTGYTIQLDLNTTDAVCKNLPTISGGPLDCDYTLDNIHFHWDANHSIDGHKYPLEAHLVHYKTTEGCLQNALKFRDGLAIIAVFYDFGNCTENVFKTFVGEIEDVSQDFDCDVPVDNICFCGFLPKYVTSYYTYQGAFKTPGMQETASWVVFSEPSIIEKSQLEAISNIQTKKSDPVSEESEPEGQELNDPNVIYNGTLYADIRKFLRDTRRYVWNGMRNK